jgi:hypothetical protein
MGKWKQSAELTKPLFRPRCFIYDYFINLLGSPMPNYRRYRVLGGTNFFTVNLLERYPNDLLIRHVEILRTVVRETRKHWPFILMHGLFYLTTCTVFGLCLMMMTTTPTVGD